MAFNENLNENFKWHINTDECGAVILNYAIASTP